MTTTEWINVASLAVSILTLMSIGIAYLAYRANVLKQNEDRIRDRDKELLDQAQRSMQWAYDALSDEGKNNPPVADRLNWLTSARHLVRGKKLANRIEHQTYRILYDEIEEYWRHRFYALLSHESLRKWTYYADQDRPEHPENIEATSALVIIDFSKWKDGVPDPTDEVDRNALIERGVLQGGAGRGLEAYLARFEEIRVQRSAIKSARN